MSLQCTFIVNVMDMIVLACIWDYAKAKVRSEQNYPTFPDFFDAILSSMSENLKQKMFTLWHVRVPGIFKFKF